MTTKNQTNEPRGENNLRANKLGVWAIVFYVVAAAAPLVGMTGGLPPAIALGLGAAAPLGYLLVGLTLLLFSVGYAAMSHRVTNAGAFFAYIGRGLGQKFGLASAFVSILAYLSIQWCLYGFFGGLMAGQFGMLPWWAWTGIVWALITLLSLAQVDFGAKLLGVLMLAELACLLIMSVAILSNGGPEGVNFAASFNPSAILAGGLTGAAGISLAFAFASFIGFEATAIYGEESKNPKTTVPRATYVSVCLITFFFAITAFAVVTGLGASKVIDQVITLSTTDKVPLANPAEVLFSLATKYVGSWMATLMGFLVLSSLFAGLLAFQNSASRYFYALGRGGSLPASLGLVNVQGAPAKAAYLVSILGAVVIAIFAIAGLDPVLNLFFWFSGVSVVAIMLIEILVCLSVLVFFSKNKGDEGIFVTKIAPILAGIGLVFGEYLLMSRFGLLAGTAAEGVDPAITTWGLSTLGWALVILPFVVFAIGLVFASTQKRDEKFVNDFLA